MADNRCCGVRLALICVLSLSSIQRLAGEPGCNVGSLTSDNTNANQLHKEECVVPTNKPLPLTAQVTPRPPTVPSTTKKVTPTLTQSSSTRELQTVATVAANHTSPSATATPQLPATPSPSHTGTVGNGKHVTDAIQSNETQSLSNDTSPQGEKRQKRSNIEVPLAQLQACMIFKYFNEDTLKFGTSSWTADFSCDTTGVCLNQTNCKDHVEVNGKNGYLCCCHGDKCNTPDLLDRNLPITPSVKECYKISHNKSAPLTKALCERDQSQYCMNITQKEETSYFCGSYTGYQRFCKKYNLTRGGCYSGMFNGQEGTLCCCNEDNCNADPSYVVATVKPSQFNYNIVIYILSSMIIIVLIITVILLLVRRRKTPMDPDMVQITYSRLTADLADG